MKNIAVYLSLIALVFAEELSDCKCGPGYKPERDESGEVNCRGTTVKSILPCNLVFKPECKCHEEATTVVQDSTGIWCGKLINGRTTGKWPCQNKEEWELFYKEHPEEKP